MDPWSFVGTFQAMEPLMLWLNKADMLRSRFMELAEASKGTVGRIGDLIVWNGETGTKIVAGLEQVGDQLHRIDSAVDGIEKTQLVMQGTLGVVQSVSVAGLGLTSLSSLYMGWRFNALNRRLNQLHSKLADIEGKIDAEQKAYLQTAILNLGSYEDNAPGDKQGFLNNALQDAQRAVAIYSQLVSSEIAGEKRLPVLNFFSRCYLLALLLESEVRVHLGMDQFALDRLRGQQDCLRKIAKTIFNDTVARDPEAYLDPSFRSDGVTIDLMTDLYRQAGIAGALDSVAISDAAEMFEHLRHPIYQRKSSWWVWRPGGKAKNRYLNNIRYVLSCLEDTNRIEALKLQLELALSKSVPLQQLIVQLKKWREQHKLTNPEGNGIWAYSFS